MTETISRKIVALPKKLQKFVDKYKADQSAEEEKEKQAIIDDFQKSALKGLLPKELLSFVDRETYCDDVSDNQAGGETSAIINIPDIGKFYAIYDPSSSPCIVYQFPQTDDKRTSNLGEVLSYLVNLRNSPLHPER